MKIAILTQPLGKNYGGIIQNYALQKTLINLGAEPTTLQRTHAKPGFFKLTARLTVRLFKKLKGKWKAPLYIEKYYIHFFKNTERFIGKHLNVTKELTSSYELKKEFLEGKFSAIVVGSDQTWRPIYSPQITNYYLDFIDDNSIKKISYASSFGVDFWEYDDVQTETCAKLVKEFDAVSVREESGVCLCKKYFGINSENVLDPTLLLKRDDYLELIDDKKFKNNSNGVFSYWLDRNESKRLATKKIANKLNMHHYTCYAKCSLNEVSSSVLDDYVLPSLESWLASFSSANLVLTDSFHGMVFSLIFEKEFFVVANKNRGASRFESLLSKLNLKDRLLEDVSELDTAISKVRPINYIEVNKHLCSLREQSLGFLKRAIFNSNNIG